MMLSRCASAWSMAQSTRAANVGSIVYGASAPAWADQLTGSRTVSNPASLIARKYSARRVTPHAPSRGASRAFPRLIPRPSLLFAARAWPGDLSPGAGAGVSFPDGAPADANAVQAATTQTVSWCLMVQRSRIRGGDSNGGDRDDFHVFLSYPVCPPGARSATRLLAARWPCLRGRLPAIYPLTPPPRRRGRAIVRGPGSRPWFTPPLA